MMAAYDYVDDDDDYDNASDAGQSEASDWPLNVLVAGIGLSGLVICIGPFLMVQ